MTDTEPTAPRRKSPWMACDCGEYWCQEHAQHAYECPCPPIEDWAHSPYADAPESVCRDLSDPAS